MDTVVNHEGVLIRYNEVALKGNNRGLFEKTLARNILSLIKKTVPDLDTQTEVSRLRGRMILNAPMNSKVKDALSRTFGISGFSPTYPVPTTLEKISEKAIQLIATTRERKPELLQFRVLTRRSDKALPQNSMEIDRWVGSKILENFPNLKVNLDQPEITLGVEVRENDSYLWIEKHAGPGGLPVGTNASTLTLLSGGIDSPVAAIQILKRGSPTYLVHFSGTPFVGPEALAKVKKLARRISMYSSKPTSLFVIPFGKIQEKIALQTDSRARTLLYRRMMVRIAGDLAQKLGAKALVTGESLGQVASQTLENICAIEQASRIPILRPLLSFDKHEIMDLAKRYETYATAIEPGADCCTLFADRHPMIHAEVEKLVEQEGLFAMNDFSELALREASQIRL